MRLKTFIFVYVFVTIRSLRPVKTKPVFTYTYIINIWLCGLKNIHPKFPLFHSFWEMVFCANFSTHWLVAICNLRHRYVHCIYLHLSAYVVSAKLILKQHVICQ